MTCLEAAKWKETMESEIQSMYDNQVWKLVDHTPDCRTVGSKIKSIRILLAIDAFHDYEIWQMDIKATFLNGKLNEDVYIAHPEGFVHNKYPDKVCKLERSIYGLKQASRSWNLCFNEKISREPGESHWMAVKNILKYLQRTKDVFLVYGGKDELRVTVNEAAKEATWLKNFIGNLGVVPSISEPIEILCDNEGAIALTKEPKEHGKSKHIERKYHFVRHKVEEKQIVVSRIPTEENPAEPFTKALTQPKHEYHTKVIDVKSINIP
ncbi:hypothetical protein OSB04_011954 [Centaurea solstitialis]|uniref:Reverse transcriptase Ty1/copia-type domain-containing protein n=1 Tax=Centaurea solstitialis TaxID=347529 RepID=A0AA38TAG2_9ASTR|nr:hypothetical protein OSB04_011954 [Centaurea solstitialis]